jgi:hypothetical protein
LTFYYHAGRNRLPPSLRVTHTSLALRRGLRLRFWQRFDFEITVGVGENEIVVAQKNFRGF